MFLKLYQADVSLGSGIKWEKCNLNYNSALKLCKDFIERYKNENPVDLKKIQQYEYLISIFNTARNLCATFYAIDASMGSFVVAFLFETKSSAYKFVAYCNSLTTPDSRIEALVVPKAGTGKIK